MKNDWPRHLTGKQLIEALGAYVEEHVANGREAYLLTFKFRHIMASEATRRRIMEREVERVYASLLPRFFRHPNRASTKGKLPIWIGSFDRPVFKHTKLSVRDVTVNDGLHVHMIALFHPERRFGTSISDFIAENPRIYLRIDCELMALHVEPIETNATYVTEYALKYLKRDFKLAQDGMIYLPRPSSQLGDNRVPRQIVLEELARRGVKV